MTTYGLTSTGFVKKPDDQIISDIQTRLLSSISPELNFTAFNPLNELISAFATECGSLWSLAQACYDAMNPGVAYGVLLDNVGEYVGAPRRAASKSIGTIELTGDEDTLVPSGSIVETEDEQIRLVTTEDGTISGGSVRVDCEAAETGEVEIQTGVGCDIVTPITGWTGATVWDPITGGRDVESDAAYRLRLEQAREGVSAATDDSIADEIVDNVENIDSATVTSNRSDVTVDGLPPHSFEAVIWPDTVDQDAIVRAIWDSQPSGIQSHGSITKTVTDTEGYEQTIKFSFATQTDVQIEVKIAVDDTTYPSNGDETIQEAIQEYFETLIVGQDVKNSTISNIAYDAVEGQGIEIITIEIDGSVQSAVMSRNEIAVLNPDPPTITHV